MWAEHWAYRRHLTARVGFMVSHLGWSSPRVCVGSLCELWFPPSDEKHSCEDREYMSVVRVSNVSDWQHVRDWQPVLGVAPPLA